MPDENDTKNNTAPDNWDDWGGGDDLGDGEGLAPVDEVLDDDSTDVFSDKFVFDLLEDDDGRLLITEDDLEPEVPTTSKDVEDKIAELFPVDLDSKLPAELVEKLSQTKVSIQTHLDNIQAVFDHKVKVGSHVVVSSLDEAKARAIFLASDESISALDKIDQLLILGFDINQLIEKARAEGENFVAPISAVEDESQALQEQMPDVSCKGVLKRAILHPKTHILYSKLAKKDKEKSSIINAQEENLAYQQELRKQKGVEENLAMQNKALVISDLAVDIAGILADYNGLLNALLDDGTIVAQVRKSYVEQFILPSTPGDDAGYAEMYSFVNNLKTFLASLDTPEGQRGETIPFGTHHQEYAMLSNGRDKLMVQRIIATMAAKDIAPVVEQIESKFMIGAGPGYIDKLLKPINDVLPLSGVENSSITTVDDEDFVKGVGSFVYSSKTMGVGWTFCDLVPADAEIMAATKSSLVANNILQDAVIEEDNAYCKYIIEHAAIDNSGANVYKMTLFPYPETVRALAVFAAGPAQSRRNSNANHALCIMAKKDNWSELLDSTIEQYPSMAPLRDLLQTWDFNPGYGTHPQIRKLSQEMAKDIVNNEIGGDRSLLGMQTFSIFPISELIELFRERHKITDEQVSLILQYMDLAGIKDDLEKQDREPSQEQFDRVGLIDEVRDGITSLKAEHGYLSGVEKLCELAKQVIKYKDNKVMVEHLCDMVTMVQLRAVKMPKDRPDEFLNMYSDFIKARYDGDATDRDKCLENLRNSWVERLRNGRNDTYKYMQLIISSSGDMGPLTQIDTLNDFTETADMVLGYIDAGGPFDISIRNGLMAMELKMEKERWSDEERTEFYSISSRIMPKSLELFPDCLSLMNAIEIPSQMKTFMKSVYPLYAVEIAMLKKEYKYFDAEDLMPAQALLTNSSPSTDKEAEYSEKVAALRKEINDFADDYAAGRSTMEDQAAKCIESIKNQFAERFGIIKSPETFSPRDIRAITDVSLYLSNIDGENENADVILGYYLALILDNQWDNFRLGQDIDPAQYISSENCEKLNTMLEKRKELNPLKAEALGISADDIPTFMKMIQMEAQSVAIGDIETVDVKLNNVIKNLLMLEDPDLYPDQIDKNIMILYSKVGNKSVNAVIAKTFQQLKGGTIELSPEEQEIQKQIEQILGSANQQLTPENVKLLQDRVKPLSTVVNLLSSIREDDAEGKIEALRNMLTPSPEVVRIFNQIGENFNTDSGAMALSQDLQYLNNVIVKKKGDMSLEDELVVKNYVDGLYKKVSELTVVYDKVRLKFENLKKSNIETSNQLLKDKFNQIEKIINQDSSAQVIMSTMTNDVLFLIENIRACLSCMKTAGNNDTNLSIGDVNKFYLFTQAEEQKSGSVSDQLVFVEPITRPDGSVELSFVLDRLYGQISTDVLRNQVSAVVKKLESIKKKFPDAKLSIFLPYTTISSAGDNADAITQALTPLGVEIKSETVSVDLIESAASDHYAEFGISEDARTNGPRETSGLVIHVNGKK